MNHVINDYGQDVIAIGAPGSEARVKVQYPKLIKEVTDLYFKSYDCIGHCIDEAIEMIREHGIKNYMTTDSIIACTPYNSKTWNKNNIEEE